MKRSVLIRIFPYLLILLTGWAYWRNDTGVFITSSVLLVAIVLIEYGIFFENQK